MVAKKIFHPLSGLVGPDIKILKTLEQFGLRLGLERIEKCLEKLGNPHKSYPSIIIGGTNGKGSVAAILHSILRSNGYRTGSYTSPHLVSLRERFCIDKEFIREEELSDLADRILGILGNDFLTKNCITYFEFTTAMAFKWFEENSVDIAILEVGMGGRLDATNVAEPLISIITTVGKDHQKHLGFSTEEIAYEKAGIIKKEGILITGCSGRGLGILRKIARERETKMLVFGRDFFCVRRDDAKFDYNGGNLSLENLYLNLLGKHQIENASLAIAGAEQLMQKGFRISDEKLRFGLGDVNLHGRFEVLSHNPVLILDGAHNVQAVESLVSALKDYYPEKRVRFIFGAMRDKDIRGMLRVLSGASRDFYLTAFSSPRAENPLRIREFFKRKEIRGNCFSDVKVAFSSAVEEAESHEVICVTGSLYLVGEFIRKACIPSRIP